MASELLGLGISAGASIIGQGINAGSQANLNKKNREWNEQQAEKQRLWNEKMYGEQNAWNYEMWQKENEYNTPEAQVQRLRDAGLNPLYYGLDGSSAGDISAAQPLGYERAEIGNQPNPYAGFGEIGSQIAQTALLQAQADKVKSETQAINVKLPFEVDSLKSQIRNSNLSSDAQEIVNKYIEKQQEAELRMKDATVAEAESVVKKSMAEIDKMNMEQLSIYYGVLETQEKILNLQKQRDLTDKQMEELESLIRKNNAETGKLSLEIENFDNMTVIGTASHAMSIGPVKIQEGEPITLAMQKKIEARRAELEAEERAKRENKSTRNDSYGAMTKGSGYEGPIYD